MYLTVHHGIIYLKFLFVYFAKISTRLVKNKQNFYFGCNKANIMELNEYNGFEDHCKNNEIVSFLIQSKVTKKEGNG